MGLKKSKTLMPSLLAIAVFQAMCCTAALAANDVPSTPITIDESNSEDLVIGKGNPIIIQEQNSVWDLLSNLNNFTQKATLGIVGGEGAFDAGTSEALGDLGEYFSGNDNALGIINTIAGINTAQGQTSFNGSTSITVGDDNISPVVIGLIGGDLGLSTGVSGSLTFTKDGTSNPLVDISSKGGALEIVRAGDSNLTFNHGNVFGAIGGSAALAVGDINAKGNYSGDDGTYTADLTLDGNITTTLQGSVNTQILGKNNTAFLSNGGLAMAIGGSATSIVKGDSNITVNSDFDFSSIIDGRIDGITVGLAGGGAALSTIGGEATSRVDGSTNISIKDGLSLGIMGGGSAIALDATGIVELLDGENKEIGNDDGSSDITIDGDDSGTTDDDIVITFEQAIQGGTAKSKTGDTNITLSGTTTAIGVLGGGMALASHSYVWRGDGSATEGNSYSPGDAYGSSEAQANSGKSTIDINTNGWALGVAGGGLAIGLGPANSKNFNADLETGNGQGAFAVASNEGAELNLINGHAAGVFGGGIALTVDNASARAEMTNDVNIKVASDTMSVYGLFGNGLAIFASTVAPEADEGTDVTEGKTLTGLAEAKAGDININVTDGNVTGIVGGGLALTFENVDVIDRTNAQVTSDNIAINVSSGKVSKMNSTVLDVVSALVGQILDQQDPSGEEEWDQYVATVNEATKDIAIVAGGIAIGDGSLAKVTNAEVNITGDSIVTGDIIAGGISIYGQGSDTISSQVEKSVINEVTGALVGSGYKFTGYETITTYASPEDESNSTSTLNISGRNTLSPLANDDSESKIRDFDVINIKAGSITKVEDLEAGNELALINAVGTKVTTEEGALLDINQLTYDTTDSGNTYLIAAGATTNNFWGNADLLYDRTEAFAATEMVDTNYQINHKSLNNLSEDEQKAAGDAFAESLGDNGHQIRGLLDEVITNADGINDGAKQYFSDASTQGHKLSSGMMLFAEAAGVTSNSISIASDMADNSVRRLSFIEDNIVTEPKVNENGALWLRYIHTTNDLEVMDSSLGGIDSDSDFDGVTLGADLMRFGNFQAGLAFSYGQGESDGSGIDNDVDMWGVNAYGSYKLEQINFIADLGYSQSDNELEGYVNGKKVTGERDVSIITAGLRAEAQFTFDNLQVVPYAGLRYYSVDPDDYTSKYDGKDAFHYDSDRLNLWTLPIGVSLRAEFETAAGFKIIPQVETAFIWAFGDNEDNALDVSMGTGASSTLEYSVMDTGSWLGKVGLEMAYKSFDFGFGYSYQKGSDAEDDMLYVNAEYTF